MTPIATPAGPVVVLAPDADPTNVGDVIRLADGDYRVLEERPVVSYGDWEIDGAHPACVTVDDFDNCVLMDARGEHDDGAHGHRIALPGAVPGGVALILKRVEP
jgi:hypothetical protein